MYRPRGNTHFPFSFPLGDKKAPLAKFATFPTYGKLYKRVQSYKSSSPLEAAAPLIRHFNSLPFHSCTATYFIVAFFGLISVCVRIRRKGW